jgi:hypothetical protein
MDWELAMRRQAVTAWRDRQILAAHTMLNNCAQGARNAFEAQLAQATVLDSVWDPAGFSNHRIDTLMHDSVINGVVDCFACAGQELGSIDARLGPLGEAMGRAEGIALPLASQPSSSDEAPARETLPSIPTEAGVLTRLRETLVYKASSLATYASETADWLVQDKAGLRDRLRDAAANRIATQWMGDIGDPLPVLAQMIENIERVAHEARTELL